MAIITHKFCIEYENKRLGYPNDSPDDILVKHMGLLKSEVPGAKRMLNRMDEFYHYAVYPVETRIARHGSEPKGSAREVLFDVRRNMMDMIGMGCDCSEIDINKKYCEIKNIIEEKKYRNEQKISGFLRDELMALLNNAKGEAQKLNKKESS